MELLNHQPELLGGLRILHLIMIGVIAGVLSLNHHENKQARQRKESRNRAY